MKQLPASRYRCGEGRKGRQQHPRIRVVGQELERGFDDHSQSAQRAGVKLIKVVAGDILDHLAARLGGHAFGGHDADADKPFPRQPIGVGQRPAGPHGEDTAHRGAAGLGRLQRNKFTAWGQVLLQRRQIHPGLDSGGHVGGLIIQHPVERSHI